MSKYILRCLASSMIFAGIVLFELAAIDFIVLLSRFTEPILFIGSLLGLLTGSYLLGCALEVSNRNGS